MGDFKIIIVNLQHNPKDKISVTNITLKNHLNKSKQKLYNFGFKCDPWIDASCILIGKLKYGMGSLISIVVKIETCTQKAYNYIYNVIFDIYVH